MSGSDPGRYDRPCRVGRSTVRLSSAPFDAGARSEYIVGCLLREPQDELLERIHRIRDAERMRLRAEIAAEREAGAKREAKRATAA